MKILIAETVEGFRESIRDQLKSRYTVYCSKDGAETLELIRSVRPDVLVLDLHLPVYDGFSVLQAISFMEKKPKVLATAFHTSAYVFAKLEEYHVGFVVTKPCTVCSAVNHIYSLLSECDEDADQKMYDMIDQFLHTLGFSRSKAGYACVREALYCVHVKGLTMVTKEVYPEVAKVCGGSSGRVEKAIRDAIKDAWSHRANAIWGLYFPVGRDGQIRCPTNATFLWTFSPKERNSKKKFNVL